ncbi:MAG TPA: DUF1998 domain-containing protein [Pseudonocardiaceae bacterium]|nr:DUF1998 domain-containing protein [Pseudonocardiaceae bacterium]
MANSDTPQPLRVGGLRQNQLLHTFGVGAMADLPNISVVVLGLNFWQHVRAVQITEERLLAAVRARLGQQVEALRLPPCLPETQDPFGDWTRVGVPVDVFPCWLRCTSCDQLGHAHTGNFELVENYFTLDKIRYVHPCRGSGGNRPTAVPARFVLACSAGHLDDFPWLYYVHQGTDPGPGHTLQLREIGTTGEAADVLITCACGAGRTMAEAFGQAGQQALPGCRGRHPQLGTFTACGRPTRTLVLGATNGWFPMQMSVITVPSAENAVDHLVATNWDQLNLLVGLSADVAKRILPTQGCWPDLEPFGVDETWDAITRRAAAAAEADGPQPAATHQRGPEGTVLTNGRELALPDFTTRRERVPATAANWLDQVTLVSRLREVSALYGFTRIDAPEWDVTQTPDDRQAPLSDTDPTWVPCAETRGEGIFLRFKENRLAEWERSEPVRARERALVDGHRRWRRQRNLTPDEWPGARYVLLHSFAHALIREFALESGYSAAGIRERVYAVEGMAGVLFYTAAPDSEGTLGGLVSLGRHGRLGPLIDRALAAARLCSSDPLCAEHDPAVHGRLHGAACHACLFASETSCERGNCYLDRVLLVDTIAGGGCGFLS